MAVLWETEFYAISVVTGKMERFRGMFISADNMQLATQAARIMKLDYLQLTGEWYESYEHVTMDDEFYKKLTDPHNIVKDMTFDEFMDWLELAIGIEDLEAAREEFIKAGDLEEYVKVINTHIKIKYGEEDQEENDPEDEKDKGEADSTIEES